MGRLIGCCAGKALYAAYFGVLVAGHYVYATGAWEQRDLYAERQNVWGSVTTYLQAEADRKYAPPSRLYQILIFF
jgi:hypothetical protein